MNCNDTLVIESYRRVCNASRDVQYRFGLPVELQMHYLVDLWEFPKQVSLDYMISSD